MKQIIALLAILLAVGVVRAEGVDEQAKLKVIQEELKTSQEKLKQARVQRQAVLGKLVVITQELKKANRTLNKAKAKIEINETKIGELVVEQKQTEAELGRKASKLELMVREAWKAGGTNYLDLLLGARSMSDLLNRLYYFEKVLAQDQTLIRDIKGDMRVVKNRREVLADRTEEIKELAQVISEKKKKIAEQAEEKKQAIEALKERTKEYEHKIAELERSSQELSVLIQKKVAERSRVGVVARVACDDPLLQLLSVVCWKYDIGLWRHDRDGHRAGEGPGDDPGGRSPRRAHRRGRGARVRARPGGGPDPPGPRRR